MVYVEVAIMKFLKKIRRKIDAYFKVRRARKILKKHGCDTWAQYYKKYDPGVNVYANTVKELYHGYKYLVIFEQSSDLMFDNKSWNQGLATILDWCEEKCKSRWRHDFLRVYTQHGIDVNGDAHLEYFINDLANDALFFAFTDEKDYAWFMLRWK